MMNELTRDSRDALTAASQSAKRLGQVQVQPEHLLVGILAGKSLPALLMLDFGLYGKLVEARARQLFPDPEPRSGTSMLSEPARTILHDAARLAPGKAGGPVDPVALTRALLSHGDPRVAKIMGASNVSIDAVLEALAKAAPDQAVAEPDADDQDADEQSAGGSSEPELATVGAGDARSTPHRPIKSDGALRKYGIDLVALAKAGKIGPAIGREREIEQLMTVLSRRSKNSPCLVGPAGVGKTAVVEGLAVRLAAGEGPEHLLSRSLIALDVPGMIAGAKLRGDFEERLKAVIADAVKTEAIVFIDELHAALGAGSGRGGLNAGNLLKEPLARGQLSVVGATTLDEYRKHVEKDPALERRFQPVVVAEPSPAVAEQIVRGLAPAFAAHHGVMYTPAALAAAVALSRRYMPSRRLPDKAIDVIDEAGAAGAMAMARAGQPVRDLYEKRSKIRAAGSDDISLTAQIVQAGPDLGLVDEDRVARVVAAATGVPVEAMDDAAVDRLRGMSERLTARVVGQDAAVAAVVRAVRRRRQGLGQDRRPASFIFAGPTGVGKSELAKALAAELFGADGRSAKGAFIQIDMSEFGERTSTARLVGAPPGYAGHEDGTSLVDRVRRSPYAVILLDEVEKANPAVFDTLLQVLEDGRLTDGRGQVADFSNAIIILTSNLGADGAARADTGFAPASSRDRERGRRTLAAVKDFFRPEFLNRIDETIVFEPLGKESLAIIAQLLLADVRALLSARGVALRVTPAAVDVILRAGFDPKFGARPLRRAVTDLIITPLSEALLSGSVRTGSTVTADADGARLTFEAAAGTPALQPVPEAA